MDGLTKRFGGVLALDACSFTVEEGTITGLIGPNGSGKTTAFNMITGYLRADGGSVRFAGRPVAARADAAGPARALPHVPAGAGVRAPDAAREPDRGRPGAVVGAASRRAVRHADRERALDLLREFGLERLAAMPAGSLSFGQRKLLEFATLLMGRPRLVLLDEPTAGVNPVMVETMERHIRELHARGLTFLVVEHDMNLVMRLCDPVVVLDHGARIMAGAPSEVQRDPRVLDAYLGAA